MILPRVSLRTFLETAKLTLHNSILNQQRITLIIGNESADLDSITSAILLAYIRSSNTHTHAQHTQHTTTTNTTNNISSPALTNYTSVINNNNHSPNTNHNNNNQHLHLYIPLINIPRADIKIRPELLKLLPYANLEERHLITIDDLSVDHNDHNNNDDDDVPPVINSKRGRRKETVKASLTKIVTTDCNKLVGWLADRDDGGELSEKVVGCIDHHVDEGVIPPVSSSTGNNGEEEPRIIETAGSCTSLVTRFCGEVWDGITGGGDDVDVDVDDGGGTDDTTLRRTWDAQLAKFAIASILMDTRGLHDKDKTEDVDREAVRYLEAKIAMASGGDEWNRETFLAEIDKAKTDLRGLTIEEILRKDYKQWEVNGEKQLGVSSVVESLEWQIKKAGGLQEFKKEIEEFATRRKLDLCAVMTTFTVDGEFGRELLVWSVDSESDRCVRSFEEKASGELGLQRWTSSESESIDDVSSISNESGGLRIWRQKEVKNSRKQVAPLLRKALGG